MAACFSSFRNILGMVSIFLMSGIVGAQDPEVFYLNPGPNAAYSLEFKESVLRLALDKTKDQYGDYQVLYTSPMSSARARIELRKGSIKNLILLATYSNNYIDENVDYIKFPVDLGLTGKRICFVGSASAERARGVATLGQLKAFKFAQGVGAFDGQIMRDAGLEVVEVAAEDSIYHLLSLGRVDFYCRGINELPIEYKSKEFIKGLQVNDSFVLVYDLPRLFFFHRRDVAASQRIAVGLKRAFSDGSLTGLLNKLTILEGSPIKINARKCFFLKNNYISDIGFNFKLNYLKTGAQCE